METVCCYGSLIKKMSRILTIDNLCVSYGSTPVLRGVSLSVDSGEILGVVGESGSGKSTTIYAALGILGSGGKIENGTICYKQSNLMEQKKEVLRGLRGKEMALIAQNPQEAFYPVRKIGSQLKDLVKSHGGLSYREAEERMLSAMEKMNLRDGKKLLKSYPFELSGGMSQRVSIAMATVFRPQLLFADEPTSALDAAIQKQVADELLAIRRESGTAIFLVSHNMGVISYMADRIAVMYHGLVLEYGKKEEVIRDPIHPYTKNLILAVPSMKRKAPRGIRITEGEKELQGCPYQRSCPCAETHCFTEMPELAEIKPGHCVRCSKAE